MQNEYHDRNFSLKLPKLSYLQFASCLTEQNNSWRYYKWRQYLSFVLSITNKFSQYFFKNGREEGKKGADKWKRKGSASHKGNNILWENQKIPPEIPQNFPVIHGYGDFMTLDCISNKINYILFVSLEVLPTFG